MHERTGLSPVGDGSCELGQFCAEEINAARVGDSAVFLFVGGVEVAAAALGDFDDRVVVFVGDLRDEVVDAARVYLKAGIGQWAFGGHFHMEAGVGVASGGGIQLGLSSEAAATSMGLATGIGDDAAVVVEADPVERGLS